jgi:hypothetical protein
MSIRGCAESCMEDCCAAHCCLPCVTHQVYAEMKAAPPGYVQMQR